MYAMFAQMMASNLAFCSSSVQSSVCTMITSHSRLMALSQRVDASADGLQISMAIRRVHLLPLTPTTLRVSMSGAMRFTPTLIH